MKTYLVQLESHDDVISARDKISWSKAQRVLLVWPRKGSALERKVDLLLLLRHSQLLGVQLAVVTKSGDVRQNARALGIPVFAKSIQAQQSPWRRPRPRRRSFRPETRKPAVPEELRRQRETFRVRPRLNRWVRIAVFLTGVAAFLALALFFMPSAQVELTPLRHEQRLTIRAWANPQISAANLSGGIPAYPLKVVVEGRDVSESTGLALFPDKAAFGEVTFTNLTDQAVIVPAGTVLLTLTRSPERFLVVRDVKVPAGAGLSATGSARAEVMGSGGNVPAGSIRAIEGPIGLRVTVEHSRAFTGGSDRRSPAPSRRDYEALHARLLGTLKLTALEELQSGLQPDQRLLYETIQVTETIAEEREPAINQPADRMQLILRVEFEGWYIQEKDLQAVAAMALDANLEPEFGGVPGSLVTTILDEPERDESGSARWEMAVEREIEPFWSKDAAVQMIQGRRVEEAVKILQSRFSLTEPPRIKMFPSWWACVPFLPFRIELVQP